VQDLGFTDEQKQYLEGFISALVKKHRAELPTSSPPIETDAQTGGIAADEQRLKDPANIHVQAQDRWVTAGGKLVPEELAKRAKHPFDMWDEMLVKRGGRAVSNGNRPLSA
jgi:ferredoxin-nitrite reductase